MKRFYVFKDGTQQGSTATRELAVDLIRQYQELMMVYYEEFGGLFYEQ